MIAGREKKNLIFGVLAGFFSTLILIYLGHILGNIVIIGFVIGPTIAGFVAGYVVKAKIERAIAVGFSGVILGGILVIGILLLEVISVPPQLAYFGPLGGPILGLTFLAILGIIGSVLGAFFRGMT